MRKVIWQYHQINVLSPWDWSTLTVKTGEFFSCFQWQRFVFFKSCMLHSRPVPSSRVVIMNFPLGETSQAAIFNPSCDTKSNKFSPLSRAPSPSHPSIGGAAAEHLGLHGRNGTTGQAHRSYRVQNGALRCGRVRPGGEIVEVEAGIERGRQEFPAVLGEGQTGQEDIVVAGECQYGASGAEVVEFIELNSNIRTLTVSGAECFYFDYTVDTCGGLGI